MDATLFDIIGRSDRFGWADPADFHLGPGTQISSGIVARDPCWSLYTLDRDSDSAWFVDLPPDLDLSHSAFVYEDQRRAARRALQVPLDALDALAESVPPPERVIFVFSIGRCGSTLVSNVLNAVPGVWSLSEPDVYSRLILQSHDSTRRLDYPPEQVIRLIRACTRLLFRPPQGRAATVLAVKFRSQALLQADLYHRALPDAACVFLYREAIGWANSVYRMALSYGMTPVLTGADRRTLWNAMTAGEDPALLRPYVDVDAAEFPAELVLAPAWAWNMVEYLRHLRGGVPFLALRYDALNGDRRASLARLFRHCGLPPEAAEIALAAFDRDSQGGTVLARDAMAKGLADDQRARLRHLLARHPDCGDPELQLPDIYSGLPTE
jgi:hypothetical protein